MVSFVTSERNAVMKIYSSFGPFLDLNLFESGLAFCRTFGLRITLVRRQPNRLNTSIR
jgi:hypothetical protein